MLSLPSLYRLQEKIANQLKRTTKELYDFTKTKDDSSVGDSLPELIVDKFDDEQVWQELELQNEPSIQHLVTQVARIASSEIIPFVAHIIKQPSRNRPREKKKEIVQKESEDEYSSEEGEPEEDVPLFGEENDSDEESEEEKELKALLHKARSQEGLSNSEDDSGSDLNFDFDAGPKKKRKTEDDDSDSDDENIDEELENKQKMGTTESSSRKDTNRKTIVDDKFFKLSDMEAFLEMEDAKEERKIRKEKGGEQEESSDEEEEEEEDVDFFDDASDTQDDVSNCFKLVIITCCADYTISFVAFHLSHIVHVCNMFTFSKCYFR